MPRSGGPAGLVSYGRRLGRPFGVSAAGHEGENDENVMWCKLFQYDILVAKIF